MGVFHEYRVYIRFFWLLNCIWWWGVLWLISACVTASACYWPHQNHCIMALRLQERSSPVGTHVPFLAKCLCQVTQVFSMSLWYSSARTKANWSFRWLLETNLILYGFKRVSLSLAPHCEGRAESILMFFHISTVTWRSGSLKGGGLCGKIAF